MKLTGATEAPEFRPMPNFIIMRVWMQAKIVGLGFYICKMGTKIIPKVIGLL